MALEINLLLSLIIIDLFMIIYMQIAIKIIMITDISPPIIINELFINLKIFFFINLFSFMFNYYYYSIYYK